MGLNIKLVAGPKEVPAEGWDAGRHGGDREFARLLSTMPLVTKEVGSHPDTEWRYRPRDFQAWRGAIKSWREAHDFVGVNEGRWEHLVDLLEAHPELWIYLDT